MSEIRVILPDGSEKKLKSGATGLDLAKEISLRLAKKVVAANINGSLRDLQDPLRDGDRIVLLDSENREAQEVISHSCEHILAAAVIDLFPDAQVTMGPKEHSEGFYYDFDIGRPFAEDDLLRIENRMGELIAKGISFKKRWLSKPEAKKLFDELGQRYKSEIIDWIPDDMVSVYESGDFVDLCRGPHLPNASFIKAFKLLGSSGSYWRGDADKEMLQRISGIAFAKKQELDDYLFRMEEAKKRDHRKLGPHHGLFFVSEKFDSWRDEELVVSEVRVLVRASEAMRVGGRAHGIVEDLLQAIKDTIPSHNISLRSMTFLPVIDDKDSASIDLRIFASTKDAVARKEVMAEVARFNTLKQSLPIKCYFETQATEEVGPGLVMWLPNGGRLRSIIEDFSRQRHFRAGYEMVYSPHIAKSDLWRISGHLGFYHDSMFAPMNIDGNEYLLKPMNCPFHVLMFKSEPRSYRELPLRLAEFGTVYRYEMAGVLHGLMRVRGFTQDDAHIFCRWDQLDQELDLVLRFVTDMLKAFGFSEFEVNISTRPEKFVGMKSDWQRAEESLKKAVARVGLAYTIDEGGGAFYGPKIDIKLRDSLARLWQCSTIQLDFNNPERFNLEFVNNRGEKERPVMLHRALFGSIERFIGVLIEHYAAAFPPWISPEQVRVLTVSDRHNDHARAITAALVGEGLRAKFHESGDKLSAKIRKAQLDKIPVMVVIGDKEVMGNGGTVRLRSMEDKGFLAHDEMIDFIKTYCRSPL